MKKVIMVTNTIYQMIVAVQLKLTVLKDMAVDLVITDNSVDTEKYVESGKQSGLFEDIFYLKTREYCKRQGKYEKKDFISELKFSMSRFYEVRKRLKSRKRYDYLFTSNLDDFEMALYDTLRLRNKHIKLYLFEDGIATYKAADKLIGSRDRDVREGEYHKIYAVSNYGQALNRISGVFVFNPALLDWSRDIKKYSIPKISKSDKEIIGLLNAIFGYKSGCNHFENKKVIFFEESFYGDGYHVNDVELVKVIEECVGKEQMLIKLHPRNPVNRFEGYETFEQSNMPWEILYLNNDFSNMILVAISSSCVIHPFLLFNDQKEMLVLQKAARLQIPATQKVNQEFIKKKIFLPHPEVFHLVEDRHELENYIYEHIN